MAAFGKLTDTFPSSALGRTFTLRTKIGDCRLPFLFSISNVAEEINDSL
jgi:hypothetical protein